MESLLMDFTQCFRHSVSLNIMTSFITIIGRLDKYYKKNEEGEGLMNQHGISYGTHGEVHQLEGREPDSLFSEVSHELKQEAVERNEPHAGINSKPRKAGSILKNKYCNNNRLGYYPTVSCFNEGAARIVTSRENLKYYDQVVSETDRLETLDDVFAKQVADDVVWDIIDEVEAEMLSSI